MAKSSCDYCVFNVYDEEYGVYECEANIDEDDMARFLEDRRSGCPYFQLDDEYRIVRKQM